MKVEFYIFSLAFGSILMGACNQRSEQNNSQIKAEQQTILKQQGAFEPSENDLWMLIGSYTAAGVTEGIHKVRLNPETGLMQRENSFLSGNNPSYLAIHRNNKYVFAVNEIGSSDDLLHGRISSFLVDENRNLTRVNSQSAEGGAPCHVDFNRDQTYVFVANYGGGSVSSYAFNLEGKLSSAQSNLAYSGQGPHKNQNKPHAHFITQLKSQEIAVCDLGTDAIHLHELSGSRLQPTERKISLPPGSGPRHLVEHPTLPIIYVLNELSGTIISFEQNDTGEYEMKEELSTVPNDQIERIDCAAIKITSDGRFLYASNRGDVSNIAIYSVDVTGNLTTQGHRSAIGLTPRDFAISPDNSVLVVANQHSDNLVSFRINQQNGLLEQPAILDDLSSPVCVKFFHPDY